MNELIFTWTFDNKPLDISSKWFLLEYNSPDSVEQGGMYQCFAASADLVFTGSSEILLVLFAPYFIEDPESLFTLNNDTAEFTCAAIGHPTPLVEWYRLESNESFTDLEKLIDNSLLLPNSSFTYSNTSESMEASFLIIDPLGYTDYGYYLCVATLDSERVVYVQDCCSANNISEPGISNISYSTLSSFAVLAS